jgi:hypothetical protein
LEAAETERSYRQDDAPPEAEPEPGAHPSGDNLDATPPRRTVAEVLSALHATPGELERLTSGQSQEALAKPASDGEWGVVEIVPHLRDWEAVYDDWIRHLLEEDTPRLAPVDDSLWAIEHNYAGEHVPDAIEGFRERRDDTIALLEGLDEAAWRRRAVHPEMGPITLHQLADRMCDHDARHIEQARDALA